MQLLPCHTIKRNGDWTGDAELITLTYDERFLRRKVLTTAQDERFLVDLEHTTSLNHGDAFVLSDGQFVNVVAAPENLLEINGNLVHLAWHIGNRHMPCQIEAKRLLIQSDHVLLDMLNKLGASVRDVCEPFTPEGGAYGHGRTHSHDHGDGHEHEHGHEHGHGHSHAR